MNDSATEQTRRKAPTPGAPPTEVTATSTTLSDVREPAATAELTRTAGAPDQITLALAEWDGSRSFIQGVKWDGRQFVVGQAHKHVSGEDVVLRRTSASFEYLDSSVVPQAGHGSTFGVQLRSDGRTDVWLGHAVKGPGHISYGSDDFTPTPGIPNGDIAVDADHDLLCVRKGRRYRGYRLSSVEKGQPDQLFDATIPNWGRRFQGHGITRLADGAAVVLVHRDYKTRGKSRLDWYKVDDHQLVGAGSLDTSDLGDEAEGVLIYAGWVWTTSRVGSPGRERTIVATKTALSTTPSNYLSPMMVDPNKVTTFLWGVKDATGVPTYQRPPGFVVTTGVRFVTAKDSQGVERKWLLTAAGYRYAVDYLKKI